MRCSMAEQIFSAACGGLVTDLLYIPEGTAAHGEPMPEQSKSVRRKERQRETIIY